MLKKVLKKNNLELFLRFDLLGAKQTVHLVRILTFAQYAEFMILNENVLQLQLLQETFNPGGLADGGWHQIGLTFLGGKASLRSDLEEVTAQIGQSIRTGIRLEWRVLKTNVFFHGTPWAYFCSQKNWSKVASNAIFCHYAQASLWPAGPLCSLFCGLYCSPLQSIAINWMRGINMAKLCMSEKGIKNQYN